MDELLEQALAPYEEIFPQTKKGLTELAVPKKVGKARAGSYLVVEYYCVIKECDCRQVLLDVISDKGRRV
ncbi:MAG: hypothetical protein GXP51_13060, partial [Deltaproteobacteria bacterium]|nr:hypothetical protein [Deltaproteobacteria bacterium]